jgi:hypothetical protein
VIRTLLLLALVAGAVTKGKVRQGYDLQGVPMTVFVDTAGWWPGATSGR